MAFHPTMKYVVHVHNWCKYAVCHFVRDYYGTFSKKNLVPSKSVTTLWHGYFVQIVIELINGWNGIDLKSNERKTYGNLSGKREDILVCVWMSIGKINFEVMW